MNEPQSKKPTYKVTKEHGRLGIFVQDGHELEQQISKFVTNMELYMRSPDGPIC